MSEEIEEKEEKEEKEIWKVWRDTRGCKNGRGSLWELSTLGNVKRNGKAQEPYINKKGYFRFAHWSLHRAIAELFIPNPENKPTVDHINRDKTDNRVVNLRWATYKEQNENRDWEAIRLKTCHLSEEHKKKISQSLKGRVFSEETRKKLSESLKGRVFSEEHKNNLSKKMSISLKGKKRGPYSEEHKKKISQSLKGKPSKRIGTHHTEETRKKMSIARKKYLETVKNF